MPSPCLEVIAWKDLQPRVHDHNPGLAKALSLLQRAQEYRCVLARYTFGQLIVHNNKVLLPLEGHPRTVELHSQRIPSALRSLIDYPYHHFPLSILLSRAVEVHLPLSTHTAPLKVLTAGHMLGTANVLKTAGLSLLQHGASLTAGAKSLLMLPKLAHMESCQRLAKAFEFKHVVVCKSFAEQSALFTRLAECPRFNDEWHAEVLLLSSEMIEDIETNSEVKLALIQLALQQHQSPADAFLIDLVWSLFLTQYQPNNKQPAIIAETAKHLVKVMMGYLPGFMPAVDDNYAPVDRLASIFTNIYQIRHHWPVFMHPGYHSIGNPVYYSLHNPALLYPNEQNHSTLRTRVIMVKLQQILQAFQQYLNDQQCPIATANTLLMRGLANVEIDLFHPEGEDLIHNNIEQLIADDPRFNQLLRDNNTSASRHFPTQSSFFHGCARIRTLRSEEQKPKIHHWLTPLRGMRLSKEE